MQQTRFMPPSYVPDTAMVPLVRLIDPCGEGQAGALPPPPVGGGVVGSVGGGVVPPPLPPVVTTTSSNPAEAYAVCKPMRPAGAMELDPVPTAEPSIRPVIEDPVTARLSVYQEPVDTVRDELPRTVTLPLLTACNWAWLPGSNASRKNVVELRARASSPTNEPEPNESGLTRAVTV